METIKAIIFDMDGVLFDTETFYYNRRKTFLKEKGISIDHLPPRFFIGDNTKHIWQAILGDDYENSWMLPLNKSRIKLNITELKDLYTKN